MEKTGANEAALKVDSVKKEIDAIEKEIAKRHGKGFTMLRVEKHLDNRTIRLLKEKFNYKVNHNKFHHESDSTEVRFISWTNS